MSNAAGHQQDRPAIRRNRLHPLRAILSFILRAQGRWRQRQQLEELDEHLLADIGLKPEDVRRECRKVPWH